jgi:hypothetical protein
VQPYVDRPSQIAALCTAACSAHSAWVSAHLFRLIFAGNLQAPPLRIIEAAQLLQDKYGDFIVIRARPSGAAPTLDSAIRSENGVTPHAFGVNTAPAPGFRVPAPQI